MVAIGISRDIFYEYPQLSRGVLVAVRVDNLGRDAVLAALLSEAAAETAGDHTKISNDERFSMFNGGLGSRRSKEPTAHQALFEKIRISGTQVPFENRVTAIVDYVMLRRVLPMCAFDLRVARDGLELRMARGVKVLHTNEEGARSEHPGVDEFVTVNTSTNHVLRRGWTKPIVGGVTEASSEVIIIADSFADHAESHVIESLSLAASLLRRHCGAIAQIGVLTKSTPTLNVYVDALAAATDPAKDWILKLSPAVDDRAFAGDAMTRPVQERATLPPHYER